MPLPAWATVDPYQMSADQPGEGKNLLSGKWISTNETEEIVDPLNGGTMLRVPFTSDEEVSIL